MSQAALQNTHWLSKRIQVTRYLMVIGIVLLHIPPYQSLSEITTAFDHIKAFFSHGVFRASVPVLTVISGYLTFRSESHLKYFSFVWKKIRAVFLPLVIWNLPIAIAVYFIQRYDLLSHEFSAQLYPFDLSAWADAVIGLMGTPINYPLNFLRDLFAIALLAPFFWLLLSRAPWGGLVLVFLIYYLNLDGPIVLRNSMLLSFYVGGMAATQHWNLARLDRYSVLCFAVFCFACVAVVIWKIENREWLRLMSPFLIWPAMSLFNKTRFYDLLYRCSSASFFTFLAHGPMLLIVYLLYTKLAPEIPYYVFWGVTPILIAVAAFYICTLVRFCMPRFSNWVLGGR